MSASQRAAAARLRVAEVAAVLVPGDLEQALLDAMVEPRAAKHELPEPVDERLALDERDVLPVAHEVAAERAARLRDPAVGGELDEVVRLLVVEVVRLDQAEADGCRGDALLEVVAVEGEPVAEELEHVVVARRVVRLVHPGPRYPGRVNWRLAFPMAVIVLTVWIVGAAVTRFSLEQMAYLAPVAMLVVGATVGLVLLWVKVVTDSVRRRREGESSG